MHVKEPEAQRKGKKQSSSTSRLISLPVKLEAKVDREPPPYTTGGDRPARLVQEMLAVATELPAAVDEELILLVSV